MELEYNTLVFCFLLAWFFTGFDPLQKLIERFYSRYEPNIFLTSAYELLSCFYCFSLWFTLALTFDVFSALFVSFLAYNYELWRSSK